MQTEKIDYQTLLNGDIPPWVMRFIKATGKGISKYNMIQKDDNVLLAVSGGKDSLALALALSLRRKWLKDKYTLSAIMINWIEHPIKEEAKEMLKQYFASLDIKFKILDKRQFKDDNNGDYNCYICSRNRRQILFEEAYKNGESLIAMGHHLDDFVETSIMNQVFRAKIAPMKPVQEFFDNKMHVIRPMILVHENVTKRLSDYYNLPVIKPVCPYDQTNIRSSLKPIIKELSHLDKNAREHIFNSYDLSSCILPLKS